MADIKHLPVYAAANEIINEIEQNGAVIIDGFLADEVLEKFNTEIDPALARKSNNHGHSNQTVEFFHGPQAKHLTGVAGVSDTFVTQQPPAKAGGLVIRTKVRRGMHTSFCLGWLRTEENSYLSVPLERVSKMPRRAQELLGFGVHDGIANGEGFLGALDNRIPVDMIAAGEI